MLYAEFTEVLQTNCSVSYTHRAASLSHHANQSIPLLHFALYKCLATLFSQYIERRLSSGSTLLIGRGDTDKNSVWKSCDVCLKASSSRTMAPRTRSY